MAPNEHIAFADDYGCASVLPDHSTTIFYVLNLYDLPPFIRCDNLAVRMLLAEHQLCRR